MVATFHISSGDHTAETGYSCSIPCHKPWPALWHVAVLLQEIRGDSSEIWLANPIKNAWQITRYRFLINGIVLQNCIRGESRSKSRNSSKTTTKSVKALAGKVGLPGGVGIGSPNSGQILINKAAARLTGNRIIPNRWRETVKGQWWIWWIQAPHTGSHPPSLCSSALCTKTNRRPHL